MFVLVGVYVDVNVGVRVSVEVIVKVFVGVLQGSSKLTVLEATVPTEEANVAELDRNLFAQQLASPVFQKYIPAVMVTA